jgi:hypothetical protein
MEKKTKTILIIVTLIALVLCVGCAGAAAFVGIPAYLGGDKTNPAVNTETDAKAYENAANEWNSTVEQASDATSETHLLLTDVAVTRVDVLYALLNNDKTALSQTAGEFGTKMVDLQNVIQDAQSLSEQRASIVKDLESAVSGSDGTASQKTYVDKARTTVEEEKALLDEYEAIFDLFKQEQGWYEKGLAGSADTAMIKAAVDELGTQITDKLTALGENKLKFNPQGEIPI